MWRWNKNRRVQLKKIRAGRKPSSVPRSLGVMIIYLGPQLPEGSCDLPGSLGRAVLTPLRGMLPYVVLLQAGFSKHSRSPGSLVGSCPTVSPLPRRRGGLLFCGTFHGVAPCPVSGPPCPAELGLSSPRFRGAIISPALISKNNGSFVLLLTTLFSRLSPCSPGRQLPYSSPAVYILPLPSRSLQSIP